MPQPRKRKTRGDDLEANNSGVDMAFDALMDLEENSDMSSFLKKYIEGSENAQELWTLGADGGSLFTNKAVHETLK